MINLTDIGKRYDRRLDNWRRLKESKALIESISKGPDGPGISAVKGCKRNPDGTHPFGHGATFGHPDIARAFEQWCKKEDSMQEPKVFLVRAVGSDMHRIGVAKEPYTKLKKMQAWSPLRLLVSRVHCCGDPELMEKKLYEVFNAYRAHDGWLDIEEPECLKIFDDTTAKWTAELLANEYF